MASSVRISEIRKSFVKVNVKIRLEIKQKENNEQIEFRLANRKSIFYSRQIEKSATKNVKEIYY